MTVVNRSYYPVQTSMNLIAKMQDQFSTLQTQLSTGLKANSLSQLGNDRYFDLSIRSRMSRLDGYSDSINMVNARIGMFDQLTSQLSTLQTTNATAMTPGSYGDSNLDYSTAPDNAATASSRRGAWRVITGNSRSDPPHRTIESAWSLCSCMRRHFSPAGRRIPG